MVFPSERARRRGILGGELRVRTPQGRTESQDVADNAKKCADDDMGTGLAHWPRW
jgi:hypothetical protein